MSVKILMGWGNSCRWRVCNAERDRFGSLLWKHVSMFYQCGSQEEAPRMSVESLGPSHVFAQPEESRR